MMGVDERVDVADSAASVSETTLVRTLHYPRQVSIAKVASVAAAAIVSSSQMRQHFVEWQGFQDLSGSSIVATGSPV